MRSLLALSIGLAGLTCSVRAELPAVQFAQDEITRAALASGQAAPTVRFQLGQGLGPQGYRIARTAAGLTVEGGDANGEMYGGLDVAEAVRTNVVAELAGTVHKPFIAERGFKFNLPLDLRTPSYSDNGDSFQANIPQMWSREFWHTLLDEMARDRYNVLSLWSLGVFPSMVKVPEFPDVSLSDVWRTTAKLDDTFSTNGYDMVRPYMLEHHEVVARLTIDEKIQFWREVMQYAQDRGVKLYIFTWNIFTWGIDGKYGITSAQDNPATIAYFRAATRELVTTYPLLAGIGITAGEHMNPKFKGELATENWLRRTYGQGVADALKLQPGRNFRLIHRLHQTDAESLFTAFADYPGPFEVEYKYSVAHMYSLTNPPFIQELLPHLKPGQRTWVTLRNDDIYTFRWGDPDFAREYIRNIPPPEQVAGFLMGADGYCWGREAIEREPESPRQLVMERQWYSFMLWGRLGFDPTLTDGHFQRALATRFPQVPSDRLYLASTTASKIIPQITRFFWGDIDIKWFPELCTQYPTPKGFYTVKSFMLGQTEPGSNIMNIRGWRALSQRAVSTNDFAGKPQMTPLEVADALQKWSDETEALVHELMPLTAADSHSVGASALGTTRSTHELRETLADFRSMALLGAYYAEKIRGACDLATFDETGDEAQRASAMDHLQRALASWRNYAAGVNAQYIPQLLNRIGQSNPDGLTPSVEADMSIARSWVPHSLEPAPH
jgi:hypothetical protein